MKRFYCGTGYGQVEIENAARLKCCHPLHYSEILFSSYILESICLTSNRVLVLEHGKISRSFNGKEIVSRNIREMLADYENR